MTSSCSRLPNAYARPLKNREPFDVLPSIDTISLSGKVAPARIHSIKRAENSSGAKMPKPRLIVDKDGIPLLISIPPNILLSNSLPHHYSVVQHDYYLLHDNCFIFCHILTNTFSHAFLCILCFFVRVMYNYLFDFLIYFFMHSPCYSTRPPNIVETTSTSLIS